MIINRVSRLMGDRRESVAHLAAATGLAYTTAHRLYAGTTERISLVTLDRLCDHFGVTPGDLLEYVPDSKAS